MRTTVTIDEELVRELLRHTQAKTKTAAVTMAVKEQIRRAKLKRLIELLGRVEIDEEDIKSGDEMDLKRVQWLEQTGAKDEE
ncbi:MAG: type II toxin-antitoxin system VapB family antitoxin [Candidatus Desulfofervidaceae bacterium]|nr:type II toxin-antitoxin system VapB family antitoxin [Candidatus Desulfofervidaceae bacterium]